MSRCRLFFLKNDWNVFIKGNAVKIKITVSYLLKGYEVATLAQNKSFPAKQELPLSEITGLPLDAQMQRNRLDVDERVESSR
jgi:hypothetical protein